MTDRPIIFSAPMVRALLDGRKTQTRRLIKPDPWPDHLEPPYIALYAEGARAVWCDPYDGSVRLAAPYAVGDRLYVREACRGEELPTSFDGVRFRADDAFKQIDDSELAAARWLVLHTYRGHSGTPVAPWVPPIHMPRWASRLTLFVEDVRVQRLQEISEADAIAEGVVDMGRRDGAPYSHFHIPGVPEVRVEHDPTSVFAGLWELLHGEDSWTANPWIVAVTFRVVRGNIDTLAAEDA